MNVSVKCLVLAAGVASSTAASATSNLRQRRATAIDGAADSSSSISASTFEPSILLDKPAYTESEPITATFSVGPSTHSYYSSTEAPSLKWDIDFDYPKWSVGIFMRDADPQGGTLSPIVSANFCGAMGDECDVDDMDFGRYNELSVTFGNAALNAGVVQGRWPLEVSEYGTGFDAYVLDGKGAAAIGPLEFVIRSDEEEEGEEVQSAYAKKMMKFNKGTKRATRWAAPKPDVAKIVNNEPEALVEEEETTRRLQSGDEAEEGLTEDPPEDAAGSDSPVAITSNKEQYEDNESVSIQFVLDSQPPSDYKIGIFMRMANPQGGSLAPIVSLPLCSVDSSPCVTNNGLTTGEVTFSIQTLSMNAWPLDLYTWGTGYDAYVLDETGDDVVGPVKFNIMMDDTY